MPTYFLSGSASSHHHIVAVVNGGYCCQNLRRCDWQGWAAQHYHRCAALMEHARANRPLPANLGRSGSVHSLKLKKNNGEKVHGVAGAHALVAYTLGNHQRAW
jgi:hypothetical protein